MTTVAQLTAQVTVEGIDTAQTQLKSIGSLSDTVSGGFGSLFKSGMSLLSSFGVFDIGSKAISFLSSTLSDSISLAEKHQQIMAQTEQVIKSTGDASGMSAKQISDLAESLSKTTTFSEDTIQSGENLLLTFTGIGTQTMPLATSAMLDMAQAMGTDTKSAAMQLGKALNDPLTGMSALSRSGVVFSDAEKKSIDTMMAHNDVAGAQKIMLQELQTEFGGSAKAAGQTFAGQMQILGNSFDDVKEKLGSAFLPLLQKGVDFISSTVTPALRRLCWVSPISSISTIRFWCRATADWRLPEYWQFHQ